MRERREPLLPDDVLNDRAGTTCTLTRHCCEHMLGADEVVPRFARDVETLFDQLLRVRGKAEFAGTDGRCRMFPKRGRGFARRFEADAPLQKQLRRRTRTLAGDSKENMFRTDAAAADAQPLLPARE